MGIRKTELKLLPHLETKPSSQPQEFQACQLMEKLQVHGGVSCEASPPHKHLPESTRPVYTKRPAGGRGPPGAPTTRPVSALCFTEVVSPPSPKVPARKYGLLLTGKDPVSMELNPPLPEVMLRFFSTALLSHKKVEPREPDPGTPGHQSPHLNSQKRFPKCTLGSSSSHPATGPAAQKTTARGRATQMSKASNRLQVERGTHQGLSWLFERAAILGYKLLLLKMWLFEVRA